MQRTGSNRTFMELKLRGKDYASSDSVRSNRTFMELKLGNRNVVMMAVLVLIVPLWN